MKNVPLLKEALAIGNSLCILIAIISSIYNGIDTERFPITLAFVALLIIPLVLLITYGLRAYRNKNDADSYFALLAISFLFNLVYISILFRFILDPKSSFSFLHLIVSAVVMILLWVLNVIGYLNRDKLMNKK